DCISGMFMVGIAAMWNRTSTLASFTGAPAASFTVTSTVLLPERGGAGKVLKTICADSAADAASGSIAQATVSRARRLNWRLNIDSSALFSEPLFDIDKESAQGYHLVAGFQTGGHFRGLVPREPQRHMATFVLSGAVFYEYAGIVAIGEDGVIGHGKPSTAVQGDLCESEPSSHIEGTDGAQRRGGVGTRAYCNDHPGYG